MFANIKVIYLATGGTDLRKSIDGLSIKVSDLDSDPFSGSVYVFCNKNRSRMEILHWDYNGFWIYYKRLEKGRYKFPEYNVGIEEINQREFGKLLMGLSYKKIIGHKEMKKRGIK